MKRKYLLVPVAGLVAVGALGDHVISDKLGSHSPAAVATRPTSNTGTLVPASTAALNLSSSSISAMSIDRATESAYNTAVQSVVYVDNVGIGSGSGVIYDTSGDIITNNHVVDGSTSLKVTFTDGRTVPATLVGTDKVDDLAVIHVNASGLTPARFATAGSYHVAQAVLSIGSPLGLKQSVAFGLISGLARVEQEPTGAYLPNAIQTSAPINPGNSGGALVSLNGVVVGIPTLVQTSSSNGTAAQNIGFAIPSERAVSAASQIISGGKVIHTGRAYLGLAPADAGSQSISPFGDPNATPTVSGALVQHLASGGPAAHVGIQVGDVITSAGGATVSNAQDLLTVLAGKKPGDTISLKVNRNGSTLSFTVRLGELPA